MKLLIVLTFCLESVVCRNMVMFNYSPSTPLESGSAHSHPNSPVVHGSEPVVPLSEYIIIGSGPKSAAAASKPKKVFCLIK